MRMLLHVTFHHHDSFKAAVRDESAGQKILFNADVEFHCVMAPEDLKRAGLDALGKK